MSKPEEHAVEAVHVEPKQVATTTVVSDDVRAKEVYNVSLICKIWKTVIY
jgi:hypothetical protein